MNERELFTEALNWPSKAERARFLDRACGHNQGLRQRLDQLLACHDTDDSLLDQRPADMLTALSPPPARFLGSILADRYTLVEVLGEGGMGTVYRARQTEPVLRDVALKLIKTGTDSRTILLRFEAERQALALMDHPGIARVYDGGATDSGRPFFVMELVRGAPITRFCDEHRLSLHARLELFVSVCQAVQHAHRKGIIHCDLKPGNVLVTEVDGRPAPKVIDFGVARAAERATHEDGAEVIVGTPEYMSPEQADPACQDVDTRTDVYALGIILYELLAGSTPLQPNPLQRELVLDLLRRVQETEPPRPSTRLGFSKGLPIIAANRGIEPARLTALLRGELDWVVMKALARDRTQRYESASDLALDVQRYLAGEVVDAVPATTAYRLRKFLKKHRGPVVAAALVIAALVLGIAGTTWGMVRAEHARDAEIEQRRKADEAATAERAAREIADKRRAQVERGVEILSAVFMDLDPHKMEREEVPLAAVLGARLEQAAKAVEEAAYDDPLTRARLYTTLGVAQLGLGFPERTVELLTKARAIRTAELGPKHRDTLEAMGNLAEAYRKTGRTEEARALLEETLKLQEETLGALADETLPTRNNLAQTYTNLRQFDLAIPLFEKTAQQTEARYGGDDPRTLKCGSNLAACYFSAGKRDQAIPLLEETLRRQQARVGADDPDSLQSLNNLAVMYQAAGKVDRAVPLLEERLRLTRKKLGSDHPDSFDALHNLGAAYHACGREEESRALLEELLRRQKARYGANDGRTAYTQSLLGGSLLKLGKFAESERELLAAEKALTAAPNTEANRHRQCIDLLAHLYEAWNASAPGQGHDKQAAEWRARLP